MVIRFKSYLDKFLDKKKTFAFPISLGWGWRIYWFVSRSDCAPASCPLPRRGRTETAVSAPRTRESESSSDQYRRKRKAALVGTRRARWAPSSSASRGKKVGSGWSTAPAGSTAFFTIIELVKQVLWSLMTFVYWCICSCMFLFFFIIWTISAVLVPLMPWIFGLGSFWFDGTGNECLAIPWRRYGVVGKIVWQV